MSGIMASIHKIFQRKKCNFCGKNNKLLKYTDGKNSINVCHLCEDYAVRRAYRRV